jgi:hypothetical protein
MAHDAHDFGRASSCLPLLVLGASWRLERRDVWRAPQPPLHVHVCVLAHRVFSNEGTTMIRHMGASLAKRIPIKAASSSSHFN